MLHQAGFSITVYVLTLVQCHESAYSKTENNFNFIWDKRVQEHHIIFKGNLILHAMFSHYPKLIDLEQGGETAMFYPSLKSIHQRNVPKIKLSC